MHKRGYDTPFDIPEVSQLWHPPLAVQMTQVHQIDYILLLTVTIDNENVVTDGITEA